MIDTINGISMVGVRSIMSKMVEGHEIGKIFKNTSGSYLMSP